MELLNRLYAKRSETMSKLFIMHSIELNDVLSKFNCMKIKCLYMMYKHIYNFKKIANIFKKDVPYECDREHCSRVRFVARRVRQLYLIMYSEL